MAIKFTRLKVGYNKERAQKAAEFVSRYFKLDRIETEETQIDGYLDDYVLCIAHNRAPQKMTEVRRAVKIYLEGYEDGHEDGVEEAEQRCAEDAAGEDI